MWWAISGGIFWVGCGVLAYGMFFAYFQRAYPFCCFSDWGRDFRLSFLMALASPIALVVATIASHRALHGFKWGWETRNIDKDAVGLMKLLFLIKSEAPIPNIHWISQKMGRPAEWVVAGMIILSDRKLIPPPRF